MLKLGPVTMKKCQTDLLNNVYIAAPCPVSWDSMVGDDRVRLCNGCSKNVYNLSAMTSNEANMFLQENGVSECMVFYRRTDGTIMTDNCPVGLRKIRDQWRRMLQVASAVLAAIISNPLALAQGFPDSRPQQPAPPGKHWQGNPAGGGFILVDDNPRVPRPHVIIQDSPPEVKPGIWERPLSPLLPRPLPPDPVKVSPSPVKPSIKDDKPSRERTEKQAQAFFQRGLEAERGKQPKLAEFYYEKALDFFEAQQTKGDAKFRELINTSLVKVRKQLGTNTN